MGFQEAIKRDTLERWQFNEDMNADGVITIEDHLQIAEFVALAPGDAAFSFLNMIFIGLPSFHAQLGFPVLIYGSPLSIALSVLFWCGCLAMLVGLFLTPRGGKRRRGASRGRHRRRDRPGKDSRGQRPRVTMAE